MGSLSAITNTVAALGGKVASTVSAANSALGTAATLTSGIAGQAGLGAAGDIAGDAVNDTTGNTLTQYNDLQNKLAVQSMAMQTAGLQRSMVMQGLRDLIKDAKDTIKDQGEAGHKP